MNEIKIKEVPKKTKEQHKRIHAKKVITESIQQSTWIGRTISQKSQNEKIGKLNLGFWKILVTPQTKK